MADYWKSNPKKFCEVCKCWMADNKISIQNHETGMRHKGNVEKKMNELLRSNKNTEKDQKKLQDSIQHINDAAYVSMMKDIERDPSLAKQYGIALTDVAENAIAANAVTSANKRKSSEPHPPAVPKKTQYCEWQEFTTPDGRKYYYNKNTKITQWERPPGPIEPEVVSSKVEKERQKQFLMNRLVELSESGSEVATKAIYEVFNGPQPEKEPDNELHEYLKKSKNDTEPQTTGQTALSHEPYRGPKVDLLGPWVPVESMNHAVPKPIPIPNISNERAVSQVSPSENESKWSALAHLEETTETSIQNMRHLDVTEKQVVPGSLQTLPQTKPEDSTQTNRNVPRVVFRRGPLTSATRSLRGATTDD